MDDPQGAYEIAKGSPRAVEPALSANLAGGKIAESDGQLVFEGTKRGRPLSDMTFTKLLRDAGLGKKATAHGFRSAFKNWCSESEKARDEVSEAALAHTIKDRVKAAYLRTDFFEERKSLMEFWSTFCQAERVTKRAATKRGTEDRISCAGKTSNALESDQRA